MQVPQYAFLLMRAFLITTVRRHGNYGAGVVLIQSTDHTHVLPVISMFFFWPRASDHSVLSHKSLQSPLIWHYFLVFFFHDFNSFEEHRLVLEWL